MNFFVKNDYLDIIKSVAESNSLNENSCAEKASFLDLIPLKKVFDHLPGIIYLKDNQGVYLDCNNMTSRMVGHKQTTEIVGHTDFSLCWSNQACSLRENDLISLETKSTLIFHEASQAITGEIIKLLSIKTPLFNSNRKIVGTIGSSLDLLELEKFKFLNISRVKKISAIQKTARLKSIDCINYFFEKKRVSILF